MAVVALVLACALFYDQNIKRSYHALQPYSRGWIYLINENNSIRAVTVTMRLEEIYQVSGLDLDHVDVQAQLESIAVAGLQSYTTRSSHGLFVPWWFQYWNPALELRVPLHANTIASHTSQYTGYANLASTHTDLIAALRHFAVGYRQHDVYLYEDVLRGERMVTAWIRSIDRQQPAAYVIGPVELGCELFVGLASLWSITYFIARVAVWRRRAHSRGRAGAGLCGACGYDLRGLDASLCPECGTPRASGESESGR